LQQAQPPEKCFLARVLSSGSAAGGPRSWLRPIVDAFGEIVGRRGPDGRPASRAARPAVPPNPFAPLEDYVYRYEVLERLVPIAVCVLLAAAAIVSSLPVVDQLTGAPKATSAVAGAGSAPGAQYGAGDGLAAATDSTTIYLGDGSITNTMQNPGVGTDARSMLFSYVVQPGDTLTKIAGKFGLVTATVYWANRSRIPNPNSISPGTTLVIPPVDGLMVTVGRKDTLASLAAKYEVSQQAIIDTNNLPDAQVTTGQVLLIPGASGGPVPRSGTTTVRGGWPWPVGEPNYVSQYFWSGHHALDIAAAMSTPVYAAVSGTVVLSGWRSQAGGGNVIWVMVNSKLYVTYNHLSRWYVRAGQRVVAGQKIGLVGMSGNATGPHLHFEVWLGYPWALGTVADAVNPCIYLAGC
jgi:murein DD-endopeptidase MepM/ murein hydrolase activator NlpD